jgi:hypothetical protein
MDKQSTLSAMHAAALEIGKVEWGATAAIDAEGHAEHVKNSVEKTAKFFEQKEPQAMHGIYMAGNDVVICHTGTSPNSPTHARILTALWNRFVDEAEREANPPRRHG